MDVQGKGLWSEVVRRNETSTFVRPVEDGLFAVVSETSGTSQTSLKTIPAPDLNADAGAKSSEGDAFAICNGNRDAIAEVVADDFENVALNSVPEQAEKLSPTSLKSTWQKSSKSLTDSRDGAIMGSEFWPSLADSLSLKSTKSAQSDISYNSSNDNSEKDLCTAAVSSDQQKEDINNGLQNMHLGHGKVIANKEGGDEASSISNIACFSSYVPPIMVPGGVEQRPFHPLPVSMPEARAESSSSGNGIERESSLDQKSNKNDNTYDAWTPRNRSGGISNRGGMPHRQWYGQGCLSPGRMQNRSGPNRFNPLHERAPRQRGNGGPSHSNFGNRSISRDQGRGQNLQPQQFYADGPNYAQPCQHPNVDYMNVVWNVPTYFHPNFSYVHYPAHEGAYYPLVRSPGFLQGAGYSIPSESPPALPPASQDASPSSLLAKQIEYYFSNENLVKDAFLRSRMDAQGFVPAALISSFNLIRKQNADTRMILEALQNSAIVEVQGEKLRSRYYWQMWIPTSQNSSLACSDFSIAASNYNSSANISRGNELTKTREGVLLM